MPGGPGAAGAAGNVATRQLGHSDEGGIKFENLSTNLDPTKTTAAAATWGRLRRTPSVHVRTQQWAARTKVLSGKLNGKSSEASNGEDRFGLAQRGANFCLWLDEVGFYALVCAVCGCTRVRTISVWFTSVLVRCVICKTHCVVKQGRRSGGGNEICVFSSLHTLYQY